MGETRGPYLLRCSSCSRGRFSV